MKHSIIELNSIKNNYEKSNNLPDITGVLVVLVQLYHSSVPSVQSTNPLHCIDLLIHCGNFIHSNSSSVQPKVRTNLRNGFLLTVICCPIYYCLEVISRDVIISRAQRASDSIYHLRVALVI